MAAGKKVNEVVNKYMIRSKGVDMGRFALIDLACSGFKELSMDCLGKTNIKVARLDVTDINTVNLPVGYLNYIKIGVPAGGKLWTLTVNNEMLGPDVALADCDVPYEVAREGTANTDSIGGWYYSPNFDYNGKFSGRMYSVGGGWNSKGYVKEDPEHNRLLLDEVSSSYLIVEYKSNDLSADTVVPDYAVEALIAWMRWQVSMYDIAAMGGVQYLEQVYHDQALKVKLREHPFRIDEYLDSFYEDVHLSVKR